MIRVLQSVNNMDRAGLETMIMNYYRNIDHDKVQFDFLTHRVEDGAYDEEIKELGGIVYHAPRLYPHNLPKYYEYMRVFYQKHPEYHTIHSHIDTMSYFPLKAAKENNIKNRIAHSHTSGYDLEFKLPIKWLAAKGIKNVANYHFACGTEAGKFLFPNDSFEVIHNAIDLNGFKYDEKVRNEVKKELGLEGKFVLGHVGSYIFAKNQTYLIDVLNEMLKVKNSCHLLLIGTNGNLEDKLRKKVKSLGLDSKVTILRNRSDVYRLYNAMDVFAMPSTFEGLPMVAVEAQTNGLPGILSDGISSEAVLTKTTKMMSIKSSPSIWAKEILRFECKRNKDALNEVRTAGYDILTEAKKLENFYLSVQ